MANIRMNPALRQPPELSAESPPIARRGGTRPVVAIDSLDVDRRRSLREELTAAEKRWPTLTAEAVPADTRALADAIARLGDDAARVLQAIDTQALRRMLASGIDERA